MAEAKKIKIKKKEWYTIRANDALNGAVLGESFVSDMQELIGKTIKVNLMQISNESRHQNVNVKFIVKSIVDKTALADIIGYEISPSTIKRFVRKEKKKLDLSFPCITSDGVTIRIKPIMVIKKNAKGSTQTQMRKHAVSYLTKTVQKLDFKNFFSDLVAGRIQDGLRKYVAKIYPAKILDIRQMFIVSRGTPVPQIVEETPTVAEEPKEKTEEQVAAETN